MKLLVTMDKVDWSSWNGETISSTHPANNVLDILIRDWNNCWTKNIRKVKTCKHLGLNKE